MRTRLPPLESLRVFEVCARHSNFSRAASELGVTPTAVSLRIRDLEGQLGIRLFDRRGPVVKLSAVGAELGERLSKIVTDIGRAVDHATGQAQTIRVTVVPTVATVWLMPRLGRYQARDDAAPVKLDVSTDLRPSGTYDVAIRSGSRPWPGMSATDLFPIEVTPMLSPGLAASATVLAPGDLMRLPLLPDGDWPRWFEAAGVPGPEQRVSSGVEYPSQDLAASAAASGAGVALLSPKLFAPMIAEGRLVQPCSCTIEGPGSYSALVAKNESRPSVLEFVAWLAAEAAESTDAIPVNRASPLEQAGSDHAALKASAYSAPAAQAATVRTEFHHVQPDT